MRDVAYYLLVFVLVVVFVWIGIAAAFVELIKWKRRQQ